MTVTFKSNDKAYQKLLREMKLLNNSYVDIGLFPDQLTVSASRIVNNSGATHVHKRDAGLSLAQIAYDNEFGTVQIPARPFMSTSFDENIASIRQSMGNEYKKILSGKSTTKQALNTIGVIMQTFIRQKILAIRTPVNSPRTIYQKGSSKPLIDFGQMVNAIDYRSNV